MDLTDVVPPSILDQPDYLPVNQSSQPRFHRCITQHRASFPFSSNPGHLSSLTFCATPTILPGCDYWEYIMVDLVQGRPL
ncbi:uncharacterized protein ARMOST_02720 [Armillaria ostoyae]|uniref:Uncharacterized protein n=1 Tax=Armillaria ostoyae TaxID=47428 RepID=A0A284QSG6_ARMOS|nr:uncharacterized protein ARMOST_02720 [Armillaria ostoyae]